MVKYFKRYSTQFLPIKRLGNENSLQLAWNQYMSYQSVLGNNYRLTINRQTPERTTTICCYFVVVWKCTQSCKCILYATQLPNLCCRRFYHTTMYKITVNRSFIWWWKVWAVSLLFFAPKLQNMRERALWKLLDKSFIQ